MTVQQFTPSQTHVSKSNVRPSKSLANITELANSIREQGQLQHCIVRMEDGKPGILAGQRRRAALCQLQKSMPDVLLDAVVVDVDDAQARAISLSENISQQAMSVSDQWRSYPQMIKDGWTVKTIAKVFSSTEKQIYQVLALGSLAPTVLTAFDKEDIDNDALKLLACANKSKVAQWVKLYRSGEQYPSWENDMTAFLFNDYTAYETSVALFDVDGSGLAITTDLFNDKAFFADTEAFWTHQHQAIELEKQSLLDAGWKDVVSCEHYFYEHGYEKRTKKDGGNIFIETSNDGSITFHKGFVSLEQVRAEQKAVETGESVEGAATAKAVKPEITRPLYEYLSAYITQSAKAKAVCDSDLGKRILLSMLLTSSGDFTLRRDDTFYSIDGDNNKEITKGEAFINHNDQKKALFKAVGLKPNWNRASLRFDSVMDKCLAASNDQIDQLLSFVAADAMVPYCEATLSIHEKYSVDMSPFWNAEQGAGFFEKLRNKKLLLALVEDVSDKAEVAKLEKSKVVEIKQRMVELVKKVKGWTPRYFDGKGYLNSKGLPYTAKRKS